MIRVFIYKNKAGDIFAFKVKNHGPEIICAAVSVLAINTVNSIEAFTEEEISCKADEKAGLIAFELPRIKQGGKNEKAELLLNSMLLGLTGISGEYPDSVKIKEVKTCSE
jgi:uncharacterized protein YsxB (DUF464 family)